MQKLYNPKWILFINLLPLSILLFLYWGQFEIIQSLLKEENLNNWYAFGTALAAMLLTNLVYFVVLHFKRKNVSVVYGVVSLIFHIALVYLFFNQIDEMFPRAIPQWMIPDSIYFYPITFAMPTIAYSLLLLVFHFSPQNNKAKAWKDFSYAAVIPLFFYLYVEVIQPMFNNYQDRFVVHAQIISVLVITVVFLFFVVRGTYILIDRNNQWLQKNSLIWKIPITVILPTIGLLFNNGILFGSKNAIIGDYSGPWFYTLVLINGILLCLPDFQNKAFRLFLFLGRSITFSFTLYFFVVLLPFLPLSLILIIAFGLGFTLMAPSLLMVLHTKQLQIDWAYLKSHYNKFTVLLTLVLGFLFFPAVITGWNLHHKATLHEALEYLYSPDYTKDYEIDTESLETTLSLVYNNSRVRFFGNGKGQQPYLTSYFNWLVLDNLTLSNAKINRLNEVFFGEPKISFSPRWNINNDQVVLTGVATHSTYDAQKKQYTSTIDLEITNQSDRERFNEYATTFTLPTGSWISDYYLFVNGVKEYGLLAEKKSAMWVFNNIRRGNRDPGILYYTSGNEVAFQVFPFTAQEVRKTGFEIIHKEPITIPFDGRMLTLGDTLHEPAAIVSTPDYDYLPKEQKEALPMVNRKPYFHFMVDATVGQDLSAHAAKINQWLDQFPDHKEGAVVSLVGSTISTTDFTTFVGGVHRNLPGGFFLRRAFTSALYQHYEKSSETYPIMVVVSDSINQSLFDHNLKDWQFTFPETDIYYVLNQGSLEAHSLISDEVIEKASLQFDHPVYKYTTDNNQVQFLPIDHKASIVLKNPMVTSHESGIIEKDWNSGLLLQAMHQSQVLHPDPSNDNWLNGVKYSFKSHIMTPSTSFMVVENEAQKAMLKKMQDRVLSGNKSLDPGEDVQSMSEPRLYIMLFLAFLFLYFRERKKTRKAFK